MACCFTIWGFPGTPHRPTPRGLGHGRAAEATWICHPKSIGVVPALRHHHCCSASSLNGFQDQNGGSTGWMDMNVLFSDFNGGSMISGLFSRGFPIMADSSSLTQQMQPIFTHQLGRGAAPSIR